MGTLTLDTVQKVLNELKFGIKPIEPRIIEILNDGSGTTEVFKWALKKCGIELIEISWLQHDSTVILAGGKLMVWLDFDFPDYLKVLQLPDFNLGNPEPFLNQFGIPAALNAYNQPFYFSKPETEPY